MSKEVSKLISKYGFRYASIAKSSPLLSSKPALYNITANFSTFRVVSRSPIEHLHEDLSLSVLEKQTKSRDLGPGTYNTPEPPSGPSYNFGYSVRFKLKHCQSPEISKSTDKITKNKNTKIYTPSIRNLTSREKSTREKVAGIVNKQAKEIIAQEKQTKLKLQIDEKIHRIEVRKQRNIRNPIVKSYSIMLLLLMSSSIMLKRFEKVRNNKRRIGKLLRIFSIFCRAIGKLRFFLRHAKVKFAWKVFRRCMPELIRNKQKKVKEKFMEDISAFCEKFLKSGSFARCSLLFQQKIRLIQRNIRGFLIISKHRKFCVKSLWEVIDASKVKIPENIKNYYITSYIKEKIKRYSHQLKKISQFFTFLTASEHLSNIKEAMKAMQEYELPILQFYNKKQISKLIKTAYEEKANWNLISFPAFPTLNDSNFYIQPPLRQSSRKFSKVHYKFAHLKQLKSSSKNLKQKKSKKVRINASPIIIPNS